MKRTILGLLILALVSGAVGFIAGDLGGQYMPAAIAAGGDDYCIDADPYCVECIPCLDKFGQPTGQIKCRHRAGWYPSTGECCGAFLTGYGDCFTPN